MAQADLKINLDATESLEVIDRVRVYANEATVALKNLKRAIEDLHGVTGVSVDDKDGVDNG